MKIDTISIHGGSAYGESYGSATAPIYQTTAYAYSTADELADVFAGRAGGYIYSRLGNPTNSALERRLAEMEGGVGCVATASGMAAITALAVGLLRAGDEIVCSAGIFGGTISLFRNTLGRFGVKTTFVDAAKTEQFINAVNENTKFIFVEAIGNPKMDVPDLRAIAAIARGAGIPFVVDSTVTTPVLIRPKDFGADIVIHSTSKFINGHGTAIGGAIVDTGNYDWSSGVFAEICDIAQKAGQLALLVHLRNLICRDLGGCASPMNSFLMLQGLDTLNARMRIHCENAHRLALYLQNHTGVLWVNYPGLSGGPFCDRVAELFGGCGGALLTFGLGDRQSAWRFIDALRLAKNLANLGEAKSLVLHPASTIFHEFSDAERERIGVTEDMVRVSVGLEDFEDIRDDFEQAIEKSAGGGMATFSRCEHRVSSDAPASRCGDDLNNGFAHKLS